MSRVLLTLKEPRDRAQAVRWCGNAPAGTRLVFHDPKRTLPQNDRMWAMLGDVARQVPWQDLLGRPMKMTDRQWKLFFLDMLNQEAVLVPKANGVGTVNVSNSSSELSVGEMSDLMTIIEMFGAVHGVTFDEPTPSTSNPGAAVKPRVGEVVA